MAENQSPTESNLSFKYGYIVGVSAEGKLVFRTLGSDVGLLELLGANAFAGYQIKTIYDVSQKTGDALTARILQLLERELTVPQTEVELGTEKVDNQS